MLSTDTSIEKIKQRPEAVVAFTATWCGPCKQLKPQFAKAAVMLPDKDFYIIDIDTLDRFDLEEYSIKSVPTVYVMKHGKVVNEIKARTHTGIIDALETA